MVQYTIWIILACLLYNLSFMLIFFVKQLANPVPVFSKCIFLLQGFYLFFIKGNASHSSSFPSLLWFPAFCGLAWFPVSSFIHHCVRKFIEETWVCGGLQQEIVWKLYEKLRLIKRENCICCRICVYVGCLSCSAYCATCLSDGCTGVHVLHTPSITNHGHPLLNVFQAL